MNISEAKLSYKPNDPEFAGVHHCTIESLKAEHEGSPIEHRLLGRIVAGWLLAVASEQSECDGP